MKRLVLLLIALAVLTGCATNLPPYMVGLNSIYRRKVCTGAMLDRHKVLTAYHCVNETGLDRIVTTQNTEHRFTVIATDPANDLAILYAEPTFLTFKFAKPGPATEGFATLYGMCPLHFPYALLVKYVGKAKVNLYVNQELKTFQYDAWATVGGRRACGGDSGGFILQDGNLVGVTSAVMSDEFFSLIGRTVYTIPTDKVTELIDEVQSK